MNGLRIHVHREFIVLLGGLDSVVGGAGGTGAAATSCDTAVPVLVLLAGVSSSPAIVPEKLCRT